MGTAIVGCSGCGRPANKSCIRWLGSRGAIYFCDEGCMGIYARAEHARIEEQTRRVLGFPGAQKTDILPPPMEQSRYDCRVCGMSLTREQMLVHPSHLSEDQFLSMRIDIASGAGELFVKRSVGGEWSSLGPIKNVVITTNPPPVKK